MKGIILAGGSGTRLYPLTQVISKQLLPVYDKPMIYYPLSIFMLAGIREILIISTPQDIPYFKRIFGDGSRIGIHLEYAIQSSPDGLAQAFIIGKDFIGEDCVSLILGDNIFYGPGLTALLQNVIKHKIGATVFGYYVNNPKNFGVIEFDEIKRVISIEEKPIQPKSNYAVTGLYVYDNHVIDIAKSIQPSTRGELEITDINKIYLESNMLHVEILGQENFWLDSGTHESLLKASRFIETVEKNHRLKIACIEEIAYIKGYITREQLLDLAEPNKQNAYGQYLIFKANQFEYN
ncbi:glucose-1-phosphate thymidylyltransferase RfbA [Bacillus cereus]|uniref:Glucose-1-phosphate thymidylyltransferase n=1 Tax=Bacillus cereus HuA2-1 TaxID=1053201 RepID=J9B599_BACCE|nr:glucose-1-phosphate thymidylyltransferase RfbA [Bacillus cereus]EJV74136.1 glucose-1-phosphate thymidylyltransferase [Bacillus cereus HuA2-1]